MTDRKFLERLLEAIGYNLDLIEDSGGQEKIIEGAAVLNRVRHAMLTSSPEKTGALFICGQGRQLDSDGLPVRLHVCPSYGLAGSATYEKILPYSEPGY